MKNKSAGLIIIGLLLIAAAFLLTAYNMREETQAKESAMEALTRLEEMFEETFPGTEVTKGTTLQEKTNVPGGEIEIPDYILNPDMEMPVKTVNDNDYIGILSIPALELELPIISQWSYPRLKISPCRYTGSAYTNNLIIAAHNYKSHFRKLKHLHAGDIVTFMDMDRNVFHYEVVESEILKPTTIDKMESGDWDLTLFTCTIGGRSRVVVRCKLVEELSPYSKNQT
ncbi:MAG: sortase [Saccharofermentanales bacterium]|jgi:sortase A|nr:sortase [Bacillota bacterium]NLB09333.1 sortase [Clostridiales bacterium]